MDRRSASLFSSNNSNISWYQRYQRVQLDGLMDLRTWILENGCQRVAIESTGIYHIPTYTTLEGKIETIVANPLQIKYILCRIRGEVLPKKYNCEVI